MNEDKLRAEFYQRMEEQNSKFNESLLRGNSLMIRIMVWAYAVPGGLIAMLYLITKLTQ